MNTSFILEALFPHVCVECKRTDAASILCADCESHIVLDHTLYCATCRARLADAKKICHKDAPMLLGAAAPYDAAPMRTLVRMLKFGGVRAAAEPLGDILARYAVSLGINFSEFVVAPLPLSRERERMRGFNQSALIARRLAEKMGLPFDISLLVRTIHRKPQSETKNLVERKANILGCFAARAEASGKNILLIDDVVTSGSTLREAARTLKAAGAKKIIALAAARA